MLLLWPCLYLYIIKMWVHLTCSSSDSVGTRQSCCWHAKFPFSLSCLYASRVEFSCGSVYLFTYKISFSQLLLMDSLLQRFLWLIQLRGLALRCLKIVKTLFSFVMLDSDLLFLKLLFLYSYLKTKKMFSFPYSLKKYIFSCSLMSRLFLEFPLSLWSVPVHISRIRCLSSIFSSHINTCSLPPGTWCKQIFPPRVSVAAESLSAKLSTSPLSEK